MGNTLPITHFGLSRMGKWMGNDLLDWVQGLVRTGTYDREPTASQAKNEAEQNTTCLLLYQVANNISRNSHTHHQNAQCYIQ